MEILRLKVVWGKGRMKVRGTWRAGEEFMGITRSFLWRIAVIFSVLAKALIPELSPLTIDLKGRHAEDA